MNLMTKKQFEFFDLADNLYIECTNKYRELIKNKNQISNDIYENELRLICSQMGLVCEYYLKGLIFPYLKISIPPEKAEFKNIIDSLTEDEVYKILIGDDEILRNISNRYQIRLKDLKFLQDYSIKSCGHNLITLIDKFSANEYIDIPEELKTLLFKEMKSYYFSYFGYKDNLEVNATDNDLINSINIGNISDSFVKGRYGHLDGYNVDPIKLIKLMHALRSCCEKITNSISITNGTGLKGTTNATDITMIHPDKNSKVYIVDKDGKVKRVYKFIPSISFFEEIQDLATKKIADELNYYNYFDKKLLESRNVESDEKFESHDDWTLVPDYGIEEMKKIYFGHNSFKSEYYTPNDLILLHRTLIIDKDEPCIIFLTENGQLVSYSQNLDNKIRKNSSETTLSNSKIIEQFEQQEHSKDEIILEFVDLKQQKKMMLESLLSIVNSKINIDNYMNSKIANKNYIDYLRKTKRLKNERKKLLKNYKLINKEIQKGRKK